MRTFTKPITIIPRVPKANWGAPHTGRLPHPLDHEEIAIFARCRHALWSGVRTAGLEPGDEVLTPAYHCGPEIEALVQAGLRCRFYDLTDGLEPDLAQLDALVGPRTRALLVIHLLGFPQDVSRWRAWCDAADLMLIEDCAQAWLARTETSPVGVLGDISVFAPYKALGAGLGSILLPRPEELPKAETRMFDRGRPNFSIDLGDPVAAPAGTETRLRRLADPAVAAHRRANFNQLLEQLGDHVHPAFQALPAGASPYVFPIVSARKPRLLADLAEHGIQGLDAWPLPHPKLDGKHPRSARLRTELVGLPVHQRLGPPQIEQIVRVFRRPRRRTLIQVECHNSFSPVRDAWPALADRAGNVFGTLDWAEVWWKHFGGGRTLNIIALREADGTLVAICPLHLATGPPVRLLRFVGYGPADQLGPICAPVDRGRVARQLAAAIHASPPRWDVFLAEQLAAEEGWSALTGARVVQRAESPVIHFDGTWADFVGARSKHLRKFLGWQERKLTREHALSYRLVQPEDVLGDALDELIELHRARWPGGSRFAAEFGFHREFATRAMARGWLRLWFLELDGRSVATWYCFRYGGSETYYQAGRDPHGTSRRLDSCCWPTQSVNR